jgi:hypothetical protein
MKLHFFLHTGSLSAPRLAWQLRFQNEIRMRRNFVPSIHLPIGQSLAFNFLQAVHRAFAVCHFAAVMAMVKLREIQRQRLFADMMKCPNNAAFEQREKSFDSVGGDEPILFAPDIHAGCRQLATALQNRCGSGSVSTLRCGHHGHRSARLDIVIPAWRTSLRWKSDNVNSCIN